MKYFRNVCFCVFTFFLLGLSACKPLLLPKSSVKDSANNKEVMAFMEAYRTAVETRSAKNVMALVAKDFRGDKKEKNSLGYKKLEAKLKKVFRHVKDITLQYHVQKIEFKNDYVVVYYYFSEQVLADFPVGEEWMSGNDVNRILLRHKSKDQGGGFEIISGL